MLKEARKKRERLQKYTSWGLPLVVLGGWFYPPLGLFLMVCMGGAAGLALYRGRKWCDWMCPRGSFYDLFLKKVSRERPLPAFMKARRFRAAVLSGLMALLGVQLYFAWGDWRAVGFAMVRVLTVTTTLGLVLGAVFQQRAWCHICPMGTIGNLMSEGKEPLHVAESCTASCKLCSKVCPMQLKPYEYRSGVMEDLDCIKCTTCVAACPKKALSFDEGLKKAA